MRYIKIENNSPVDYTIEQLFQDYPDAVIYKTSQMPNEQLLAQYNVYPLITEALPELQEDETAIESTPEFRHGEWHQTWRIRKLTESEIQEIIEGREHSLNTGNLDISNTAISIFAIKELQEKRYNICKTCDSFTALKTCSKCGCIMPLKVKLANSKCPLEKWESVL
jgi:hypothetical protein